MIPGINQQKKNITMVEPFAGSCGSYCKSARPTPGSLCGRGWRRPCCRVLYNWAYWPRKKLISELINLIFVFIPSQLNCPQNDGITLPLRSPLVKSPRLSLLCHAHVFLFGCCIWSIDWQPFKATANFFFVVVAQFVAPNNSTASAPHVPPRSCTLPNIPPTANTNFWLVVVLSNQKMATEGWDSIPLSFFWWVACWRPKQRI